jgi:anti-sigma B factor antagonist
MIISSKTPDATSNHCPVCDTKVTVEISDPNGTSPCPKCGHLLWFHWENQGDTCVITPLENRLTVDLWRQFQNALAPGSVKRLVIDFRHVRYMQSEMLGRLLNLRKNTGQAIRRVKLRNLHPDLFEVFRITRLDQVFELEQTKRE